MGRGGGNRVRRVGKRVGKGGGEGVWSCGVCCKGIVPI